MINFFKKVILQNKYFSWMQIFTNWFMQGIMHADFSEKLYKILFSLILAFFIFFNFKFGSFYYNLFYSFLIAHSINWIVNCNFCVLIIHRMKWYKTSKPKLFTHLFSIQNRLEKMTNKDWISYCVSHGGICNGTLNPYSDIDVSIIRKPGFFNMLSAILFYVKEKKIADFNGVPLDIFICDSPKNSIERSKRQKNPIVIMDHNNIIDKFYTDKLKVSLNEARLLNNII